MPVLTCVSALTYMGNERELRVKISNPNSFRDILQKDKQVLASGWVWARTHALPKLLKNVEDVIWLRHLEDPLSLPPPVPPTPPLWRQPMYPRGLSCIELLRADLKTLRAYVDYLNLASRVWTVPLPDVYDPRRIEQYFSCRPHVIGFRLVEVFLSFVIAMIKMRLAGFFRQGDNGEGHLKRESESGSYYGQLLKEAMLSLGPTFVKVGQSLSTRPDIIGSEISEALSELHDQIPSFPRVTAMNIIEEELGCPVHAAFNFLSEESVAAASFGQVYQGCTLDGCSVAVKVQRPNLHHAVLCDVYILRLGLQILRKVAKRKSDIALYADEIGRGLLGELDYTAEAKNATEFLEAHGQYSFISVPKVYHHLSRKRILTMEWIVGEKPNELLSLSRCFNGRGYLGKQHLEAKEHLLDLVNKGVKASLIQLLETGLLHADPHPGNLRYTPSGQIGFLDFGLLCRIEKKHQFALLASILHIVNGDWPALVYDLSEMDVMRPETNKLLVTRDLIKSLDEVTFENGIPDVKFSKVLGKIWSIALKYHFRMPPYYTLVLRSIASLEGLALAADPDFKTFKAAYPYVVQKLITDDSPSMRRILHSVVLNRKKELQWQKLVMFMGTGATGYMSDIHVPVASYGSDVSGSTGEMQNSISDVTHLLLRLLPSEKGAALRRLLMSADPTSLVCGLVSSSASSFRQYVAYILATVASHWVSETLGMGGLVYQHGLPTVASEAQENHVMYETPSSPYQPYRLLWKDRRVKVIVNRILRTVARKPFLMLRFIWCSCSILFSAFAQAFHHILLRGLEVRVSSFEIKKRKASASVL